MKLVGEDGEVETNKPDHSKEGGDLGEGRRGGGEEGRRGGGEEGRWGGGEEGRRGGGEEGKDHKLP